MEQVIYLKDEFSRLKEELAVSDSKRVFVVRTNRSFIPSGAAQAVAEIIGGEEYTSFFDFDPNPQVEDLKRGVALFKAGAFDLILAIGGGSVLDMAKLISVYAHQQANVEDLVQGKAEMQEVKTPLIAIPTTSGTGAEATHFAVLYMGKQKFSVAHSLILPNWVYFSPNFSLTANAYLTACTGLDAFCQAVESVWSVNATDESQDFALQAIDLVWQNLSEAVHDNSLPAKEKMQEAAFLAGKAINYTKTTAPHAISYAFSSYYGLPHGHAVALSLPFFMNYNYTLSEGDCTDTDGVSAVKWRMDKMLKILNIPIAQAYGILLEFIQSLGVETRISKLLPEFKEELIVDNVNVERLGNNPRRVDSQTVRAMIKQLR